MTELKRKHCLLVEDRPDDAMLIQKEVSKRSDFGLQWVNDAEEAVQYLQCKPPFLEQPRPDIILLDLKLPRMDGFKFLEWCRGTDPCKSIPVMVLTCLNLPDDIRRAYGLGANSYLTKPVNWTQFGQELSRLAFAAAARQPEPPRSAPSSQFPTTRLACTLTFRDGRKLRASATAGSPDEVVRFEYSGDTSILRPFAEKGTVGFLRWYMEGWAANLAAEIEVIENIAKA